MRKLCFLFVAIFLILVGSKYDSRYGFSEFACFGGNWSGTRLTILHRLPHYVKPNSNGYDGQFYAQIAMDPGFHDPNFSTSVVPPAYRSRRIFLPILAYLLGFGKPAWALQVYCILNVFFWLATAWLLIRWIPVNEVRGLLCWAACLFSLGTLDSVRLALTDLPAVFFILATMAVMDTRRIARGWALLPFAAAILTRETSVIGAAVCGRREDGRWPIRLGRMALMALIASLPFLAWMAYVNSRFPSYAGVKGNLSIPFTAMAEMTWRAIIELIHGNWDTRYVFRLAAVVSLLVQAGYLLWRRDPESRWWRLGVGFAVLFVFLGVNVWWGYWAVCRVVLPMTFAFNVLILKEKEAKIFWPLLIVANLTIIHAVIRFL